MNIRIDELTQMLKRLITGDELMSVEFDFSKMLGEISPEELAQAEDLLVEEGISIGEIQRANELHTDLVSNNITFHNGELTEIPGHPAFVFKAENSGIRLFIANKLKPDLDAYLKSLSETDRMNLLSDTGELDDVIKHYERKENLFFPYLEKSGITAPPQVMWGVDDIIKDLIRLFAQALEQKPVIPKRVEMVYERLSAQIESMIVKENEILIPMLLHYMKEEDWILTAEESKHIGYVFNKGIEGASNSDVMAWLNQYSKTDKLIANENEHAGESDDGKIILPSGRFTIGQLTAMLDTLPTDLTFIDSNDIIQYYSEGKHQVFARTRTIIGRNVYLCHPPQLIPTIKKLIESFKSGEKDYMLVPVRKGSLLNLVRYYAVRNDQGKYIGTVEVTEEISGILEIISDN